MRQELVESNSRFSATKALELLLPEQIPASIIRKPSAERAAERRSKEGVCCLALCAWLSSTAATWRRGRQRYEVSRPKTVAQEVQHVASLAVIA
jgi:hypothetical protein